MDRWLRDNGLREGFKVSCLSCDDSKGVRCTLALQGSQSNEKDR